MRMLIAALAVLAFATTDLAAQNPPDFSGSWTLSEMSGGPQGAGSPRGPGARLTGFGQEATVSQDANTLTILSVTPQGEVEWVYNLDGSASPNTIMGMGGNSMQIVSTAEWDDDRLIVTTPLNFGGNAFELRTTLDLDESGHLVVSSASPMGGGTIRAVYTQD